MVIKETKKYKLEVIFKLLYISIFNMIVIPSMIGFISMKLDSFNTILNIIVPSLFISIGIVGYCVSFFIIISSSNNKS